MASLKIEPKVTHDFVSLGVCYGKSCSTSEDYKRLQEFKDSVKTKEFSGYIAKVGQAPFTELLVKLHSGEKLRIRYGYVWEKHWGYYTFNPGKLVEEDWVRLTAYFNLLFSGGFPELAEKGRIARYDIALDYKNVSFDQCVFIDRTLKTGEGELIPIGTAYLGHKRGLRGFCCYDKRRQMLAKQAVVLPYDLLRIELRLRNSAKLHLSDIPNSLANPFTSLAVVDWGLLTKSTHIECRTLVKRIAQGQPPDYAFNQATPFQRKYIWSCLKSCIADWWDPDLAWQAVKEAEGWHHKLC